MVFYHLIKKLHNTHMLYYWKWVLLVTFSINKSPLWFNPAMYSMDKLIFACTRVLMTKWQWTPKMRFFPHQNRLLCEIEEQPFQSITTLQSILNKDQLIGTSWLNTITLQYRARFGKVSVWIQMTVNVDKVAISTTVLTRISQALWQFCTVIVWTSQSITVQCSCQ